MGSGEDGTTWTRRGLRIGLWVLTVLVGLQFALIGGAKLLGEQQQVDNFIHWGYPTWFLMLVGVAEVAGALLLLVPRVATIGAALLALDPVRGRSTSPCSSRCA